MNPTHNQDNSPEPRLAETTPESRFVEMLANDTSFRTWIAQAPATANSYSLTEAGREALADISSTDPDDAPAAWVAVSGWCEVCGRALPWRKSWPEPLCPDCIVILPLDHGREITIPQTAGKPPVSSAPVDITTVTDDEVTALVLRLAADYLRLHGWIQGAYFDMSATTFTPAADMAGAIAMICYGGPVEAPAQHFNDPGFLDFEAAVLHLDRFLLVENSSEAYEFNDTRGRRAEDVIRVMREAAARPAHELIDALQAIDKHNTDMAALAALVVPGGVFATPCPDRTAAGQDAAGASGGDA